MSEPLERAIQCAGGAAKLGRAIGVTGQAISQWDRVPVGRVLDVERATGVPRHELRPDIYPPPTLAPADAPHHDNAPEEITTCEAAQ